jgi:phosphoribosylaminoimidazole-succinocarboxamide synthase
MHSNPAEARLLLWMDTDDITMSEGPLALVRLLRLELVLRHILIGSQLSRYHIPEDREGFLLDEPHESGLLPIPSSAFIAKQSQDSAAEVERI